MILLVLFLTFFKIGAFTFGGGYAMLPLIQAEVIKRSWVTEQELIDFIAVSESTPGPFAVNMATFIGSRLGGDFALQSGAISTYIGSFLGSACATLGVVLPSFIIILIVAKCFEKFKTNSIVKGCMSGLKPATIGLIGSAIVSVGKTVFFSAGLTAVAFSNAGFYVSLAIFAVMCTLAFKKVHPIAIICLSAAAGIAAGYLL